MDFAKMRRISGFVYVLSNQSMPGLLKIGATSKDPTQRAQELQTTGVPEGFTAEFAIWDEDVFSLEGAVHNSLHQCRVSESREFFQVSLRDAVYAVLNCHMTLFHCNWELSNYDDAFHDSSWLREMASTRNITPEQLAIAVHRLTTEQLSDVGAFILSLQGFEPRARKTGA